MTSAFGGVENGDAKHMLAPNVTANRNAYGVMFRPTALCIAIGAMRTAVAVLLRNRLRTDVVR